MSEQSRLPNCAVVAESKKSCSRWSAGGREIWAQRETDPEGKYVGPQDSKAVESLVRVRVANQTLVLECGRLNF